MKTKINEVPSSSLMQLMYKVEAMIEAENKPLEEFIKAFQDVKRVYKASLKSKK